MAMSESKHDFTAKVSAEGRYFHSLANGILEIPHCIQCRQFHFFPRPLCPHCGSDELEWVVPSGKGTVYSTTTVRRAEGDYNVCLVDLLEGPRLMSRVEGVDDPSTIRIGMKVRAQICQKTGSPLLIFVAEEMS